MWLKPPVTARVAAIVAVASLCLVGCGSSSSSSESSRSGRPPGSVLTVMPASGGPATAFAFSFTAPVSTGPNGKTRLGYSLGVLGSPRPGCVGSRTSEVPGASKGAVVSVTLDPAKLGGRWCEGTFAARITEIQTPVCAVNTLCPQYVRVVGTVARTTFRVKGP